MKPNMFNVEIHTFSHCWLKMKHSVNSMCLSHNDEDCQEAATGKWREFAQVTVRDRRSSKQLIYS